MESRKHCAFTKLTLQNVYRLIKFKGGAELINAFQTGHGDFEYRVIAFVLRNTVATSQAYINDYLQRYIDNLAVCYPDS